MRVVSTNEFRDNLSDYLDSVVKDESPIVIKRFGKALVKVVPYKEKIDNDFRRFYGFMGKGEDGILFENRIRRNKKEKKYVEDLRKGYVRRTR